ncbi:MAG TPA: NAD(P)H-binding protein [Anaerolineales bacterium]|nr:NAD(P)H-binding protein [Anaerolineales bacterium]
MKLTIFGATGRTGRYLVEQALDAGHNVTAYVRNPAKLRYKHENLHVVQGEITEVGKVVEAIAGADAVISALGGVHPQAHLFSGYFNSGLRSYRTCLFPLLLSNNNPKPT